MGKVRILSGGEDGRYTVEPVLNESVYTALRQHAEDQEAFAATLVTELDTKIADIEAEQADAIQRVDNATSAYVQAHRDGDDISAPLAELNDAQANLAHISSLLSIQRTERSLAEARRFEAQKTINALDAEANPEPREAWCADFTEDAEGEVASIEVPGEPQEPIIIYPQGLDQGHHQPDRDGLLTPRSWQTGPQVYYNAAILPGWQRYMPTYRLAAITGINSASDVCDVLLDEAGSSAQSLDINERQELTGVPIKYMTCDSAAFDVGDRVVLQFHNIEEPAVVGFEKDPRPCSALYQQPLEQLDRNEGLFEFTNRLMSIRRGADLSVEWEIGPYDQNSDAVNYYGISCDSSHNLYCMESHEIVKRDRAGKKIWGIETGTTASTTAQSIVWVSRDGWAAFYRTAAGREYATVYFVSAETGEHVQSANLADGGQITDISQGGRIAMSGGGGTFGDIGIYSMDGSLLWVIPRGDESGWAGAFFPGGQIASARGNQDFADARVQLHDANGALLWSVDAQTLPRLGAPRPLTARDGSIYIVYTSYPPGDTTIGNASHHVQRWSIDGDLLATWTSPAHSPGDNPYSNPNLAAGGDGRIYLGDNNRLYVFDSDLNPDQIIEGAADSLVAAPGRHSGGW